MRPMTRLVLGLVVLVGISAAVSLGLPSHVTVTRSVVINAPEPIVFPYLNNLHQFSDWSPWQLRDPKLAVSYAGPESGKGATVQWTSQVPSIGTGSMEITGSEPNRHIDLAVNFNGLDGTSSYDISPAGSGSKVTWAFGYDSGTSPLKRWKALMLDGFVGSEYRAGLDRLKEKIEFGTPPDRADHQRYAVRRCLDRSRAACRGASARRGPGCPGGGRSADRVDARSRAPGRHPAGSGGSRTRANAGTEAAKEEASESVKRDHARIRASARDPAPSPPEDRPSSPG